MAKGSTLSEAVARQIASNRSGGGHQAHFASHRARLTSEITSRAPGGGQGRLCLLGAGNAYDVNLDALASTFAEIHLVDLDLAALQGVVARVDEAKRQRFVAHAPLDVSGIFDRLEEWSRVAPRAGALASEVDAAVGRVCAALPGPFDVVVSCCMLTQLQLVLLEVVGDHSPAFQDLRAVLSRIHVRVLASLMAPTGMALLVTDLTGSDTYPLDDLAPDADLGKLMKDLLYAGNVIHAAHPGLLSAEIRRDLQLKERFDVRTPAAPWLWQNGPSRTYLVYAMEIRAKAG